MTTANDLRTHPSRLAVVEIARDMMEAAWTGMHCSLSPQAYREQCASDHEAWSIVIEMCGEKV